ncbi:MAG TPA: galactokinase [Actinomyces sp.]|nr:galactokinase [Acidobacteriota bacterium]HHT41370.1 galactokinase [Actinomyces sp.]
MIVNEAWSLDEGANRVSDLFEKSFGYSPHAIHSAPGRVNVIGEHTDYNGGYALPMALPHRTFAAVGKRDDRVVRLISAQETGIREVNLDEVGTYDSDNPVEGWPAYVVGVAWALEQQGKPKMPGMDVAIDSCVPFGAGLSSSAALECAVAVAWDAFMAEEDGWYALIASDKGRSELVEACISAENDIAGAPTGGMDQAASLRCEEGSVILLDSKDSSIRHIPFDLEAVGLELLVIDTRAPHQLADGQYAERRATCEASAKKLGVKYLADLEPDADLSELSENERKRTRHVITEIARTLKFAELLEGGELTGERLAELGQLMTESHESLRVDYEVTVPELDVAVSTALENGAIGARMTGGGFGGSAIALVSVDKVDQVIDAVKARFEEHGFNEPHFLHAKPSAPAN